MRFDKGWNYYHIPSKRVLTFIDYVYDGVAMQDMLKTSIDICSYDPKDFRDVTPTEDIDHDIIKNLIKNQGIQMKPVLQAIVIAGEKMRDDTLSNNKQITIREGHRDYKIGKVLLGCDKLNWACIRNIVSVRHTTLGEVTEQEMFDDGFKNYEELETCLRQWYPTINKQSEATVIRWE